MGDFIRTLRGTLSTSALWGVTWSVIGAGIGAVLGLADPGLWVYGNPVLDWALGMGAYGLLSGGAFAGIMTLGESRKSILELSLPRVALWGVLGGAVVPLFFGAAGMFAAGTTVADVIGAMVVTAFLGGSFASGSVAMARQAELAAGEERVLLEP